MNQRVDRVWPGIYSYFQEKEKKALITFENELTQILEMLQRGQLDDAVLKGFSCQRFVQALPELNNGVYKHVSLTGGDWIEKWKDQEQVIQVQENKEEEENQEEKDEAEEVDVWEPTEDELEELRNMRENERVRSSERIAQRAAVREQQQMEENQETPMTKAIEQGLHYCRTLREQLYPPSNDEEKSEERSHIHPNIEVDNDVDSGSESEESEELQYFDPEVEDRPIEIESTFVPDIKHGTEFDDEWWRLLCIPEMLDNVIELGPQPGKQENERLLQTRMSQFMEEYHKLQYKLRVHTQREHTGKHPLYTLVDYSDQQVQTSICHVHKWVSEQIDQHYLRIKKSQKERDAFEKELWKNVLQWMEHSAPVMYFIWSVQINFLFTECIVESLCSHIKRIYAEHRRKMKRKTLENVCCSALVLPRDDKNRDTVRNWAVREYKERWGDGIIKLKLRAAKEHQKVIKRKGKAVDGVFGGHEEFILD